ncbi:WD40 repeat domain-containing protein [Lentzea sp. NPDC055074]
MSAMPRGERPLDEGDSPLLRFARDLRRLRTDAGTPTYRELSRRAHFSVTTLSDAAAGRKVPGLDVTLAYVRACGGDEQTWTRRWQEVDESWALSKVSPSPYVGLSAFTREDADRFFGREKLTNALKSRLETHDFLAVFGASGEGKSSLLKAGLAQHFRHPVGCTPGTDPDASVAEALAQGPDLLIVDQFEELFTLCDDPVQREAFLTQLLGANTKVAIAVRSDFYPHCSQHPALAEALTDAQVLIGTMTPDELRRAITQPAAKVGCTVEGALLTTLIAEASGRSGVLPLVSHALVETWHRKRGNILTVGAYEAAGGIDGALAQSAETAYAQLTDPQQRLARQLLLRLAADGTKRPVPRAEVIGDEVLDVLANARLVTVGEDTVEVTHEALFRAWPRLTTWLDEDREGLRTHRRLTEAARLWEELDRDAGALYQTVRLAEACEWAARSDADLTPTEDAFLAASRNLTRRRTRRLRAAAAVLVSLVLVAGVSAVTATQQRREVERLSLLTQSQQLAALSAALLQSNPDEAARKAAEAYRIAPTTEARSQILSVAASREREARTVYGHDLRTGNGVIGVLGNEGVARVYDSSTLAPVATLRTDGPAVALDIAPDGTLALGDENGRVTLHTSAGADPVVLRESGARLVLRFVEDGRALLIGNQIWDVATRRIRAELPVGANWFRFDAAGDTLATLDESSVSLWNLTTSQRITSFGIGTNTSSAVLLRGGILAVGTFQGEVRLWNTATGTQIRTLPAHQGFATLAASADRTVLASTGTDDTEARLWDVVRDAVLPPVRIEADTTEMAFTRDGRLITSNGPVLRLLPRSAVAVASTHPVRALALDPDGSILTFNGAGLLERRDASMRTLSRVETGAQGCTLSRFNADRSLLATSGSGELVAVRSTSDGSLDINPSEDVPPAALAFAGDNRLLSAGGDKSATVWTPDPTTLDTQREGTPTAATFGKDDQEVVLGTDWGLVVVRDLTTGKDRNLGAVHESPVRALTMSPDKRTLATAGEDGRILLWDTTTWKKKSELLGHTGTISALEFNRDSTMLASGGDDETVIVWDVNAQQPWATLRGHAEAVKHVAWMPDGRAVVSAAADALLVWQLDVETALRELG